jgi:hypothetical protein
MVNQKGKHNISVMVAVQGPDYYRPPLHIHSFILGVGYNTTILISQLTFCRSDEPSGCCPSNTRITGSIPTYGADVYLRLS